MNIHMKFDTSGISKAIQQLRPLVKKTKAELVQQAAKGFVKIVVEVTPPASKGKTGSKAKAQGEQAIKSDLAKIMMAVRKKADLDTRPGAASPEELYKRFRDTRTGRINRRALARPYRVRNADLLALQRKLLARVGWLAAGWHRAAQKLGVKLPAWVSRHSGKGSIVITQSDAFFRITVANEVTFIGNVKDLDRRIQAAIDYQGNAMRRQAEYLLKKNLGKTGWKG